MKGVMTAEQWAKKQGLDPRQVKREVEQVKRSEFARPQPRQVKWRMY